MRIANPALGGLFPRPGPVGISALGEDVWTPAPTDSGAQWPSSPPLLDPAAGDYYATSWGEIATGYGTQLGTQLATAAAQGQDLGQAALLGGVATAGQIASGMTAAAWAVPVIGAAVAGITFWLSSIFKRNAQKKAATQIVNQIEPKLQENLAAYLSGPRTPASQAQALANFDAAWNAMQQACRNSQLGSAGERCITDRQQGACVWRASCSRQIDGVCVDYDLDPNGECWNWFVGYRDPIAKDPRPAAGAGGVAGGGAAAGVGFAASGNLILAITGIGLIAAATMMGGE